MLVALLAGDELILFSFSLERMKDPACVLRPSYDDKFIFKLLEFISILLHDTVDSCMAVKM